MYLNRLLLGVISQGCVWALYQVIHKGHRCTDVSLREVRDITHYLLRGHACNSRFMCTNRRECMCTVCTGQPLVY